MISAVDRALVQNELSEINTLNTVISNKIAALNSYYSKVLQKDNEERERKKVREAEEAKELEKEEKRKKRASLPTKDANKGSAKKTIRKKPNDKEGKRKSSTPNKKGTKRR